MGMGKGRGRGLNQQTWMHGERGTGRRTERGAAEADRAVVPLVQLADEADDTHRDDGVQQHLCVRTRPFGRTSDGAEAQAKGGALIWDDASARGRGASGEEGGRRCDACVSTLNGHCGGAKECERKDSP